MVAGAWAFASAIRGAWQAPPQQRRLHIDYDCSVVAGSELDYTYKLADGASPSWHKELEFSSGTRNSFRVSAGRQGDGNGHFAALVGYTRQDRESTMDGTTAPSYDEAWYIGGEMARRCGSEGAFVFASFVGGLGEIEILQSMATPLWPSADRPAMRIRYSQLAGGVGYRPVPWAELRAGVCIDMMALPHPEGHVNGTIFGGGNADKSIGAFVSVGIGRRF
jgi:hypothetical protein